MRYEKGVLMDIVTELRTAQMILNTKTQITEDDLTFIVETLNHTEMLAMSLLGSQAYVLGAAQGTQIGKTINDSEQLSPEEVSQILKEISQVFTEVILPEDDQEDEPEEKPILKS